MSTSQKTEDKAERYVASRLRATGAERGARRRQKLPTHSTCSRVGFWADLSWLMLVYCERKTLLTS